MTFEEWWDGYTLMNKYELTTADLKNCYEAGWNACARLTDSSSYDDPSRQMEKQNDV